MPKSNQKAEAKPDSKRDGPPAWRANLEDWNSFATQEIRSFLREFQGLEIAVTPEDLGERVHILVHPPYMLQSVTLVDNEAAFGKLRREHQLRLKRVKKARGNAPGDVKGFLNSQFYGDKCREASVAQGRAELEDIRRLLQEAVAQALIPVPDGRQYPDGHDLRAWLKEYGIGVDCSAFVQQTLTRLVRACHSARGDPSGKGHSHGVGWMTSSGVYRDITAGTENHERFGGVATPVAARPGDVLVKRGHIRIVSSVEIARDGEIILDLAESTSAMDIPSRRANEEADIGPRLIQVKYYQPDSPISEQTPWRRRLSEDEFRADEEESVYVLGRLRALARFGGEYRHC